MNLTLVRYEDTGKLTFGKLFINGEFYCHTLEDTFRSKKIKHETRVPRGTYEIGLRLSPRFSPKYGHEMLWVKDVPDFEWILIHKGNSDKDTSGCILVGTARLKDEMITGSKLAYDRLYPLLADKIKKGDNVTITICDFDRS